MNRKVRKAIERVGLILALTTGVAYSYLSNLSDRVRYESSKYFPERIELQERKLGIRHFSIPKLEFGYDPSRSKISDFFRVGATYDRETETICLPPLSLDRIIMGTSPIQGIIDHELGHHYLSGLLKQRGIKVNPSMGAYFVNEGIAEYFKMRMGENRVPISSYKDKFNFVKEIIDRYGTEAMICLMKRPPGDSQFVKTPQPGRKEFVESEKLKDNYMRYLGQYWT